MKEIKKCFENSGIAITEIHRGDRFFVTMCAAVWVFWAQESLKPIFKNLSCCISIAQFVVLTIMIATNNFSFSSVLLCCIMVLGLHILLSLVSWLISALVSSFIGKHCRCYLVDEAVSELPCQAIHMHEISEDMEASSVLLEWNRRCYSISLSSIRKLAGESNNAKN